MISKTLNTINKYKMLENTTKVIVALSGGADSISLTYLLFKLSKNMNFNLEAVHINHQIRGDESKRDENFARNFCKNLGIKLTVKTFNVLKIAKTLKIGTEEAGRKVRYRVFKRLSQKNFGVKIATAHSLSDNVETIIMRLISGSGLKGICGIPPVRGNIIRPLIEIKREQIENYCKENGLSFVTDSTNFEKDYTRNKIRLDVIPQLKKINPNFEISVSKFAFSVAEDEKYLENIAEKNFKNCSLKDILLLPISIKNRVLIKILKSFTNARIEQKHLKNLEYILKKGSGKTYIPDGKIIELSGEKLNLVKEKNISNWQYSIKPLNILTEINSEIIIKIVDFERYKKNLKLSIKNAVDYDKIPQNAVIRNRRSGDKFTFYKRNLTKSIKKIFSEMKIPVYKRENIPILAFQNDVIWCEKVGTSKKYIPNANTKKIAIITVKNNF